MSTESLSQEEVDALLQGVTGEAPSPQQAQHAEGVRGFDPAAQNRARRGRLPTLESINAAFVRSLRTSLGGYVRHVPEVTAGALRIMSHAEFSASLPAPASINLMRLKPLRGTALVVIEATLVSTVVESLFGGSGRLHAASEGRDFTQTEQRIIERMLDTVGASLATAWAPVQALQPEHLRSEVSMHQVNSAAPEDLAAVTSFAIEFGAEGGQLHVCLPCSMIEPLHERLSGKMPRETAEPDQSWMHRLTNGVQHADVVMVVSLGRAEISIQQLLAMQVGDVISLEIPQPLVAEVDRVPVIECRCGILNGKYALKVERLLAPGEH